MYLNITFIFIFQVLVIQHPPRGWFIIKGNKLLILLKGVILCSSSSSSSSDGGCGTCSGNGSGSGVVAVVLVFKRYK